MHKKAGKAENMLAYHYTPKSTIVEGNMLITNSKQPKLQFRRETSLVINYEDLNTQKLKLVCFSRTMWICFSSNMYLNNFAT